MLLHVLAPKWQWAEIFQAHAALYPATWLGRWYPRRSREDLRKIGRLEHKYMRLFLTLFILLSFKQEKVVWQHLGHSHFLLPQISFVIA